MTSTPRPTIEEINAAIVRNTEWLAAETLPSFRRQLAERIARLNKMIGA